MSWSKSLARIRRFLRDPNGKIWTDSQLKHLYNEAEKDIQIKTGCLEDVDIVRVPPMFDFSYLHDWEWPFCDSTTGNYQAFRYHQQADITFCHRWEPQAVWGLVDATAPDEGIHFTHPWEAFMGEAPGEAPPLQFPAGFHEAKLVAWDREPIAYITPKAMMIDDPSWVGRMGDPFAYFRTDRFENLFYLYPAPSDPDWDDIDDEGTGQVLYGDGDTLDSEYGLIADADDLDAGEGIAMDIIDADSNVLFVYSKVPTAVSDLTDESDFPSFLQKYAEYGTLERAYAIDTDGQIQSLQQYWAWRYELGIKAIQRFMGLRRADRDYRLTIKDAPGFRTRREPRLPDTYPAVRR